MNDALLRAWWSHRQGLDGQLVGASPATILERSGWARSVGGVGPYLTLHARAGISREAADDAVANLDIHELPAARGCTYVVPARDFALALAVGVPFRDAEQNVARKLGVTDKEVDRLCEAVVRAVSKSPLAPEDIRDAVGAAARSLGEAGKTKGVSSTLPIALGKLQADGAIRRVSVNGRLDQQRYKYARWSNNPLKKFKLSAGAAQTELARHFFSWIGPAKLTEFQWFSGLGVKAAQAAIAPLKLLPIEAGDERLLHAADFDALRSFHAPATPQYTLVSSLDAIATLRRDFKSLLDSKDHKEPVPSEKGQRAGGSLIDMPAHAILDRGRVVGLWEFDAATQSIAWMSYIKKDAALTHAVCVTEQYVREQLGDARSFSLDSPKSREPRIKALRAAA